MSANLPTALPPILPSPRPVTGPAVLASSHWPAGVTPTADYDIALDFMQHQTGHLFVTGRAGTGKSTLLRALRDMTAQASVVVAPTGLAAVTAGGQTIHSFFGLPPKMIQPEDIRRSRNGGVMRRLKLLIIDEISMVRSDVMAAIDLSLRLNRSRPKEPFGGVRLLLFGDLHQLPPVVRGHEEAAYLEDKYGGPFFFGIPALREGAGTSLLELQQVFRQKDEALLEVLNHVRDGTADETDLKVLNNRVSPIRTLSEGDPYVILTPTNDAAYRINNAFLNALAGDEKTYEAGITGEFNENAAPTDMSLSLKVGAKVILLRNDADKRWVNGTIARITGLDDTKVKVDVDGREYDVEAVSWENRRFAFDQKEEKIVETVAGTFKQLPLRLAWALTIHKSQGLTLDKVYIDLGRGTFAHGQAYVALSRCRTLDGMSLARPLRPSDIMFDTAAMGYRDVFPALI